MCRSNRRGLCGFRSFNFLFFIFFIFFLLFSSRMGRFIGRPERSLSRRIDHCDFFCSSHVLPAQQESRRFYFGGVSMIFFLLLRMFFFFGRGLGGSIERQQDDSIRNMKRGTKTAKKNIFIKVCTCLCVRVCVCVCVPVCL